MAKIHGHGALSCAGRKPISSPARQRLRLSLGRRAFWGRGPTMDTKTLAVVVTLAFSVVGVLGDYFLKLASREQDSLRTPWFYVGFALYAATAFGWVFVMKHLKLGTISVLYSVSMVVLLTAVGVVIFRESLNYAEVLGLFLAISALFLLIRFA